jgi:adenylosuccinate synthase
MGLFAYKGVHCVVDGQYGSTGKGALSAYLAEQLTLSGPNVYFEGAIYSGGPNSGHTCYFKGERIVLKQLPTFSVYASKHGVIIPVYLSAGAIIDRDQLKKEAEEYPRIPIFVHPNAAILTDEDKKAEEIGSIAAVAGTRSGTGAALIRKISREDNAIADKSLGRLAANVVIQNHRIEPERHAYFMEVSQGFSLGINSHFYPKVTSRECTVMQGLADARIAPRNLSRTYMAIRTFPIRVGNVDGHSSGNWYSDQYETSWEAVGVEPELTTVTKRIRRVATFSVDQFYDACYANDPDVVFVSHMDYLSPDNRRDLLDDLRSARANMNKAFTFLLGYGPTVNDIWREEDGHQHLNPSP